MVHSEHKILQELLEALCQENCELGPQRTALGEFNEQITQTVASLPAKLDLVFSSVKGVQAFHPPPHRRKSRRNKRRAFLLFAPSLRFQLTRTTSKTPLSALKNQLNHLKRSIKLSLFDTELVLAFLSPEPKPAPRDGKVMKVIKSLRKFFPSCLAQCSPNHSPPDLDQQYPRISAQIAASNVPYSKLPPAMTDEVASVISSRNRGEEQSSIPFSFSISSRTFAITEFQHYLPVNFEFLLCLKSTTEHFIQRNWFVTSSSQR